jgi:hypothetical protein
MFRRRKLDWDIPMCRPRINDVLGFRSLCSWSKVPLLIWELLPEMLCNLRSCSNPNTLLAGNIFNDLLEGLETTWLANASAMSSNRHHLGRSLRSFFIESVEGAFDVVVEICWTTETGWDVELKVVAVCHLLEKREELEGKCQTI